MEMRLVRWGDRAESQVTGKPVGIMRWIWRHIRGQGQEGKEPRAGTREQALE